MRNRRKEFEGLVQAQSSGCGPVTTMEIAEIYKSSFSLSGVSILPMLVKDLDIISPLMLGGLKQRVGTYAQVNSDDLRMDWNIHQGVVVIPNRSALNH